MNDLTAPWSWSMESIQSLEAFPAQTVQSNTVFVPGMWSWDQFFFLWSRWTFHSDNLPTGQGRHKWDFITASQIHPSPAGCLLLGLPHCPALSVLDWITDTEGGSCSTILATLKHFPQTTVSITSSPQTTVIPASLLLSAFPGAPLYSCQKHCFPRWWLLCPHTSTQSAALL